LLLLLGYKFFCIDERFNKIIECFPDYFRHLSREKKIMGSNTPRV
jgi:hypothetical protein